MSSSGGGKPGGWSRAVMTATTITDALNEIEGDSRIEEIQNELDKLKEDIVESILLGQEEEKLDVNDLSYEEYMELPGNVRL